MIAAAERLGATEAATLDRRHLNNAVRHFQSVPTKKPRYTVTDSGVVSELLDQAQTAIRRGMWLRYSAPNFLALA